MRQIFFHALFTNGNGSIVGPRTLSVRLIQLATTFSLETSRRCYDMKRGRVGRHLRERGSMATLFVCTCKGASMSDVIDFTQIGPAVGERFSDVALPDQHGNIIDLHRTCSGRRAVVLFHRSAGW